MANEWGWNLRHTLDSKKYSLYENGQVTSVTLKNIGETPLHIYDLGIQFDWQRKTKHWWGEKCDIFLESGEEAKLPVVRFRISIDIKPRTWKYRLGVKIESYLPEDELEEEWEDHGIV